MTKTIETDDYQYDIFLSYSRKNGVKDWVWNHFEPLLKMRLDGEMAVEPRIFIDNNMETGVKWPLDLQKKLLRSKCLVVVWSPQYFRSAWCMAEWKSMLAREEKLGLKTPENTRGLVYPVVFSDGEHFPTEATETRHKDLHKWNYPYEVFKESVEYLEFDRKIQEISKELSLWISEAPQWKKNWPIATPATMDKVQTKAPRLK